MRPLHARLMVLGTAALALGALACSHDLGTGPTARPAPSFSKNAGGNGVIRSFKGKKASFAIDHGRSALRDNATGKEVKVDAASLEKLEKGFDALDAMERKMDKIAQHPGFAAAMERASHSTRRSRAVVSEAGGLGAAAFGSVAVANGIQTAASGNDICTEIELQIYYGTQVLDEAKAAYEELLQQYYILGWGINLDGSYGYSFDRFAVALATWAIKADAVLYRITIQRNTLDYLAIEYQLFGCWNQYAGAGGDPVTSQPAGSNCKEMWGVKQYEKNGVWVTYWEGWVTVCGDEA